MKTCAKCKEEKELTEFSKNNKNKLNGLSSWCKKCQNEDKKIHYQKNKDQYLKNVLKNSKWVFDLKATLKCERCGYDKHPAALDFHHKDPLQKEFNISGRFVCSLKNKEKIMKEIEKCEVICSNCHRIEHSIHYNKYMEGSMQGA